MTIPLPRRAVRRSDRSPRWPAVAALAAAAGLAASGCSDSVEAPSVTAPPVLVAPAESRTLVDRIEATGQLLAQAEAAVAAQVSGQITGVSLDEGAAVEPDQVVIEIDPVRRRLEVDDSRAQAVQAEAELEEAEREARRIEQLHARGAASQAQLDEARTARKLARSRLVAAQARLGLAERALSDSSVVAPFAGLIARRHVNVGEFVNAGEPLFEVVALDPIEVEFHLPETDSSRVTLGDPVDVRVAPFPEEVFHAEVTVIAPTIDPATRTLRVKAVLPNPDGRLRPGLFARADLGVAEREGVVMVPEEAVLQRSDGAVLFRLAEAERPTVERLNVDLGVHRDGFVEIRRGVDAGDPIVVRGQTDLIDGAVVSVRDAEGRPVEAPAAVAEPGGASTPGGPDAPEGAAAAVDGADREVGG